MAVLVQEPEPDTALVYCSLDVLLQGCPCRWDQLDVAFLSKQFATCLVDIGFGACSVVKQCDEPFNGMHGVFINTIRCSGEKSECLGQLRQRCPHCPCCPLSMSGEAGDRVAARQSMKHR